jgi:hypothetical protein
MLLTDLIVGIIKKKHFLVWDLLVLRLGYIFCCLLLKICVSLLKYNLHYAWILTWFSCSEEDTTDLTHPH